MYLFLMELYYISSKDRSEYSENGFFKGSEKSESPTET